MKTALLIFLLSLLPLSSTFAQELNLGSFPVGKWVDSNYDARWTFTGSNIQLHRTEGPLVFDFHDRMRDFAVKGGMKGMEIAFHCDETDRMYKFVKEYSNPDLKLIIEKAGGLRYETVLKRQQ